MTFEPTDLEFDTFNAWAPILCAEVEVESPRDGYEWAARSGNLGRSCLSDSCGTAASHGFGHLDGFGLVSRCFHSIDGAVRGRYEEDRLSLTERMFSSLVRVKEHKRTTKKSR